MKLFVFTNSSSQFDHLEFKFHISLFYVYTFWFSIESPEIDPMTFGKDTMNVGDFAQVVCVVSKGDEPLSLTWSFNGAVISSEPSISTTLMGTRTSTLTIQSVGDSHSGVYTCSATNRAGSTSSSATLKVMLPGK